MKCFEKCILTLGFRKLMMIKSTVLFQKEFAFLFAIVNEICEWNFWMKFVNEICEWNLWMKLIFVICIIMKSTCFIFLFFIFSIIWRWKFVLSCFIALIKSCIFPLDFWSAILMNIYRINRVLSFQVCWKKS